MACRDGSSRDLPGGAFFGILDHDSHSSKFVADAIGLLEILSGARSITRRDRCVHNLAVHRNSFWITFEILSPGLAQQSEHHCRRLEFFLDVQLQPSNRSDAAGRDRMKACDRACCIKVVTQKSRKAFVDLSSRLRIVA